ncbi:hypothetical protein [Roseibium marinum]|uniref:Uncharacterized protein n=1 Tax=Roseibium marinum TaxID=281252 RepID=A0A2S3V275_9HYPH|nr:hypothetical protein [Roseibium marinum]POF34071.1 hypothetical protein CLV41_101522 [Roseibium marinum]
MKQTVVEKSGSLGLSPAWLIAIAGVLLPAICGLVFFWPEQTIANVDDLFFVPWALEFASGGRHWNPLLAVQFPGLESYHLQPRLHLVFAGWFFAVAGAGTATLVLFEFGCYVLTSLIFVLLCLKLNLRLAALFTPLLFAPMYVIAGFRLELSGALIWLLGLLVSLPLPVRAVSGDRVRAKRVTAAGIFGKALLGIAPLAAPALFAWSLGAIAVLETWRLVSRQAGPVRIMVEGWAALAIALTVFAVSIDFEFAEFLRQFTYHAGRSTGGGVNGEAVIRAFLYAGAAAFLFRKSRVASAVCLSLAAGQLLAAFLHDKALVRNLAASMVFLMVVDAAFSHRWAGAKAAVFATVFLVLSANFLSFYFFSQDIGNREVVTAAYRQDLAEGRRVFIDETMAQHFLDQQTGGALSWTWGGTFPKGRPTSMAELGEGDVWYISDYTLRGYLRGRHDVAQKTFAGPDYRHVPQIPCLLGRQSCRLPEKRWSILRLERRSGVVRVQALGEEAAPRPLVAD